MENINPRFSLDPNVGQAERWISGGVGAALCALAVGGFRNSKPVWASTALGFALPLLFRAATGHCSVYKALGIDKHSPENPELPESLKSRSHPTRDAQSDLYEEYEAFEERERNRT
jgi:hypothetical protein